MSSYGNQWFASSGSATPNFYDYEIEQSARFDRDTPSSMNFTPSSAGDRNVWTFSVWVKLSEQYNYADRGNYDTMILNAGSTGAYGTRFRIYLYDDQLRTSSATANHNISSGKYRDTSAWYHFVTKNNSGTVVQYVNGTQVSSESLGDTAINNNVKLLVDKETFSKIKYYKKNFIKFNFNYNNLKNLKIKKCQ